MSYETRRRKYYDAFVENVPERDLSRSISYWLPTRNATRKRRTMTKSDKCVKVIAALCLAHIMWQFLLLTLYDEILLKVNTPEVLFPPHLRPMTRELYKLDHAIFNRRRRTTPIQEVQGPSLPFFSQISSADVSKSISGYKRNNAITMDPIYPSFPTTNYVIGKDICGHHKNNLYNSSDRIIISGIFSHPVAAELALTLAERCNVHHIVGLSDHLLDAEETSRLEFLFRRIPGLHLEVGKGQMDDQAIQDLFETFIPSHVFYFQPEPFKIASSDGNNKESAFTTHSGTNQLQHICNAIVKMQSKSGAKKMATSLLYVASSPSDIESSQTNNLALAVIATSNQILLDAYRIQYQLDVKVFNLPNVFGPFKDGAHWILSEEFIRIANEMADQEENNYHERAKSNSTLSSFNMSQTIISISDAVRLILVSGKFGHSSQFEPIPILSAKRSQTTTLFNLFLTLLPLFGTSDAQDAKKKSLDTSLLSILSWNYKEANPYRDPANFNVSPVENEKIAKLGLINTRHHLNENEKKDYTTISQLERRQHNLFPCVSVCASFVQCRSSIWEQMVSITKRATKGCQFLLLAADFSLTLEELPVIRESTNNAQWPRDSFCQLAFVSFNSVIAKSTIRKELEEKSNTASLDEINGEVSNNGWTLVWIDKDERSISQADSMIPKTNPESIVNPSVEGVFYIEPQHFQLLPTRQVMWFLMGRQLHAPAQIKDVGIHKEWLIPERQIEFFIHTYNESNILLLDSTKPDFIPKAARFILQQNGKIRLAEESILRKFNTTRQSKAYTSSLIWQKEEGLKFQLLDTPLIIYMVHNTRGRQFRCEWYEEQLFWSNEENRYLEGLSLSYVLHRWRRRGRLFRNTFDSKWGEMMLLGDNGKELAQSNVEFMKLVNKERDREEFVPPLDPQHYVKIHTPLIARKFYSYG